MPVIGAERGRQCLGGDENATAQGSGGFPNRRWEGGRFGKRPSLLRILSPLDFSAYYSCPRSVPTRFSRAFSMKKIVQFCVALSIIGANTLLAGSPAEQQLAEAIKAP